MISGDLLWLLATDAGTGASETGDDKLVLAIVAPVVGFIGVALGVAGQIFVASRTAAREDGRERDRAERERAAARTDAVGIARVLDYRLGEIARTLGDVDTRWPPARDLDFEVAEAELRLLATQLDGGAWNALSGARSTLTTVRTWIGDKTASVSAEGRDLRDLSLAAVESARAELDAFAGPADEGEPATAAVPARA